MFFFLISLVISNFLSLFFFKNSSFKTNYETLKYSYLYVFFLFSFLKVENASKAVLIQGTYVDSDYSGDYWKYFSWAVRGYVMCGQNWSVLYTWQTNTYSVPLFFVAALQNKQLRERLDLGFSRDTHLYSLAALKRFVCVLTARRVKCKWAVLLSSCITSAVHEHNKK